MSVKYKVLNERFEGFVFELVEKSKGRIKLRVVSHGRCNPWTNATPTIKQHGRISTDEQLYTVLGIVEAYCQKTIDVLKTEYEKVKGEAYPSFFDFIDKRYELYKCKNLPVTESNVRFFTYIKPIKPNELIGAVYTFVDSSDLVERIQERAYSFETILKAYSACGMDTSSPEAVEALRAILNEME